MGSSHSDPPCIEVGGVVASLGKFEELLHPIIPMKTRNACAVALHLRREMGWGGVVISRGISNKCQLQGLFQLGWVPRGLVESLCRGLHDCKMTLLRNDNLLSRDSV